MGKLRGTSALSLKKVGFFFAFGGFSIGVSEGIVLVGLDFFCFVECTVVLGL